jgi:hypothetical protein
MKQHKKFASLVGLFSILALVVLPATVYAAGQPQLQLSADKSQLRVGQQVTVEVQVKHAPPIYGADVGLSFDQTLLEVVDADTGTAGIQVQPGRFLDASQGFFLQHQVDNAAGTIDYALTLLNPAPPAEGNGVLVRVTFRAKAAGQATVTIVEGLFGTQTGETIAPSLGSVQITIKPARGGGSGSGSLGGRVRALFGGTDGVEETDSGSRPPRNLVVLGLGGALALVGLFGIGLGGWFWLGRAKRR